MDYVNERLRFTTDFVWTGDVAGFKDCRLVLMNARGESIYVDDDFSVSMSPQRLQGHNVTLALILPRKTAEIADSAVIARCGWFLINPGANPGAMR